ncbi:DUF2750 domain-containing protein [Teredinibacter waterburyi]|uniref:DUF2750 domain-containing protein n=1 Tax=Teredinibacter waterburyi TaxID=1500538 RepID=UPI00165EFBF5|nr:DUF2750 domain-containing protein [Teredinibacter waterburyi]
MSDTVRRLSDDFEENYRLFIEEALETGCVWGLENDEGWALCPANSNAELDVMPLWSQPEYAKAHCVEEWSSYVPVPISLEELLDDWLPGMHEDVLLVGTNWDASLEGLEVEPLDLLEDVDEAVEDLDV